MPKPSDAADTASGHAPAAKADVFFRNSFTTAANALTEQRFLAAYEGKKTAIEKPQTPLAAAALRDSGTAQQEFQARTAEAMRLSIANTTGTLTNKRFSFALNEARTLEDGTISHLPTIEFTADGAETGFKIPTFGYADPFDDSSANIDKTNLFGRDPGGIPLDSDSRASQMLRTTDDGTSRADDWSTNLTGTNAGTNAGTNGDSSDKRAESGERVDSVNRDAGKRLTDEDLPDAKHESVHEGLPETAHETMPETMPAVHVIGTAAGAVVLLESIIPWFKIPPQQRSKYYSPPNG